MRLLAQLFRAGMLHFDAAPSLSLLFARRAEEGTRKRRAFVNPLALRMRLFDPTRLLDRLESKNLVRRERSSADRRVVNIELTPAGRAAATDIPAVLCAVQNAALAGFTSEEWHLLRQLLERVLANASALQVQGEAPA